MFRNQLNHFSQAPSFGWLAGGAKCCFHNVYKTPICKEIKCPFPQKSVLYSSTSISVLVGDFPFHESVFFTLCTSKAVIGRFPGSDFQEFSSCRLEICCHCPVAESRFGLIKLQAEHNPALLLLCTRANIHFSFCLWFFIGLWQKTLLFSFETFILILG